MFWAEEFLSNQKDDQVINDSFTPSGEVHMGSLKGPVIHDVLFRVLKSNNKAKFIYGFDDMDVVDGLSPDLQSQFEQYLGIPLFLVPSPVGKGSFADYFISRMLNLLNLLGVEPEIYRTHQIYKQGKFNNAISRVLDYAPNIRKIYSKMYHKDIPDTWFPFQVICPSCSKLGTTKVIGWDGNKVSFSCEKSLVKWAKGCGKTGKIFPFDGNGKMPWKIEWAAKWATFGVTIETAGKDHSSAGSSYDIASKICQQIFECNAPLTLGYEFFLTGGKKMSSSKGLGMTGVELLKVLDPVVARFLMIKTNPTRAVEFNPLDTDFIPKLYDDYQKAAMAYFEKTDKEQARVFELSQIREIKKPPAIRFSVLAQWVQMPNMQEKIEKEGLEDWAKYAKVWLEKYAPESEKFAVRKDLPEEVKNLTDKQKEYLRQISKSLKQEWNGDDYQKYLYELSKTLNLHAKEAFAAIYISLLGKNHGPRAAWLILSLDKKFIENRFSDSSI